MRDADGFHAIISVICHSILFTILGDRRNERCCLAVVTRNTVGGVIVSLITVVRGGRGGDLFSRERPQGANSGAKMKRTSAAGAGAGAGVCSSAMGEYQNELS